MLHLQQAWTKDEQAWTKDQLAGLPVMSVTQTFTYVFSAHGPNLLAMTFSNFWGHGKTTHMTATKESKHKNI